MARAVHKDSAAGKLALQVIGKEVRVSVQAKELLEDFRHAACLFGNETDEEKLPLLWEKMQMRMHELTYYIGCVEREAQLRPETVMMKF